MTRKGQSGDLSARDELCVKRRDVLRGAGKGLALAAGCWMGVGLEGCVVMKRHVFQANTKGTSLLIPDSQLARLQTLTDVLEVRSIKQEDPIFIRKVNGQYVALSSTCTHRGCEVESNPNFYECPCHSSRFDLQGRVLNGPATQSLDRFTLQKTPEGWELKL